ncbi:sperm-specific protein PHI-2B-like [Penaeus chinensis]|uniref:sperm-specific protein PHI-2B-like n=1 Tax=Penaeus chinensis TaxID=139456 RepID=UPI001FB657BC|nr:sperm-specific protein PHI-2B-like [Penaeus chinensis]
MAPVPKSKKNGGAQKGEKKRGRPKGAKNKTTVLSSLALAPKSSINEVQKKRGRPKGAKNKSTVPSSKIAKAKNNAKKMQPKTKVVEKRGRPRTKAGGENSVKFVDVVLRAFRALNNSKGSSLQAIKKYLKENDGVDVQKKTIYINKSIRKLAEDGTIRHRIGVGAKGTFKLIAS